MLKHILIFTLIQEFLIFVLICMKENEISLLHYINTSFLVAITFFLISLMTYISRSGFLDRIHDGFRKLTYKSSQNDENEYKKMLLSELVSVPYLAILFSSIITLSLSFITLAIYFL